jgi:hypothetical protein
MPRPLKFCYVSDVSWWCMARDGQGLVDYGSTKRSTWTVLNMLETQCTAPALAQFDLVRFGSLPVFLEGLKRGVLDSCKRVVLTFASLRDARLEVLDEGREVPVRIYRDSLDGLVINTQAMAPSAMLLGAPVLYSPDKVDPALWHQRPDDSTEPGGPLRVGWAGSESNWGGLKHVDMIAEACEAVAGVEFVPQRRETEGLKSAAEMLDWYHGLDLYICANDEGHPTAVPVLEAGMSGIPVITTRTGEVWREVVALQGFGEIEKFTVEGIAGALRRAHTRGREELRDAGGRLARYARGAWSFEGEAQRVTQAMEALCLLR